MVSYAFMILLFLHGLIHVMGFVKWFKPEAISQLPQVTKPVAFLWLMAALLFGLTLLSFILKKESWWMPGIPALLVSQGLIIQYWGAAKYGTVANLLIMVAIITGFGSWYFKQAFTKDVQAAFRESPQPSKDLITRADLKPLPAPVREYVRYVGVLNKEKLQNVKIRLKGRMRNRTMGWFPFEAIQYNFFGNPTRLFFMKGTIKHLPFWGYHAYKAQQASMRIKLLGLFPVANAKGPEMDTAETVTYFNDLCLMAPQGLIDERIDWQTIDSHTVKATFHNQGLAIDATLHFNEKGQLVNFTSDDRYDLSGNEWQQYRFSTPVSHYRSFQGFKLPGYGEAVWHYPDGPFTYAEIEMVDIQYNVDKPSANLQ